MTRASVLAGLMAVLCGCAVPSSSWKGDVQWPTEQSARRIAPAMEAGAILAAAAAIREMIRTNPFPNLFWGCVSPEQGLEAVVFTGPNPGLYYVVVDQRFDRCQGPRVRVLDGWYVYAVTPQGTVVAEAPPPPPAQEFSPEPAQLPAEQNSATEDSVPVPLPALVPSPVPAPPSAPTAPSPESKTPEPPGP